MSPGSMGRGTRTSHPSRPGRPTVQIGYKLATEAFGPKEIVEQAQLAERAGFDFLELSDHYPPLLQTQGHPASPWAMLGTIAGTTTRIGLATGVTCPTFRYHPAIIAQA